MDNPAPPRPPELLDMAGLEARAKAYAEHCKVEYDKAEQEYKALVIAHCTEVNDRMTHWAREEFSARNLADQLVESRTRRFRHATQGV